jgi:hypothetical protein
MKEPIHPMQALIDGWSAAWKKERAEKQLTLGKLIAALKVLEPERQVHGLGDLESYRGYYSDLAFEPTDQRETAAVLLARCQEAMGKTYMGYKGGDYLMGDSTPLWVSPYGTSSGIKFMDLDASRDVIVPVTEQESD